MRCSAVRLLDLFCGAGGASAGYANAGIRVKGIDILRQPAYPYEFERADALYYALDGYDVVHASPPCPRYSMITPNKDEHPDLVAEIRARLLVWGGPYIIENVTGAPMLNPVTFCGSAFGLGATCRDGIYRPLRRHRLFESNLAISAPACACDNSQKIGVYGSGGGGYYPSKNRGGGYKAHLEEAQEAMQIDWTRQRRDLANAVPPAYTRHIGEQLRGLL